MFDFTTEQVEFLESSGKVVLHACPGSGKTTIVARKLANYLQCWNRPHQGMLLIHGTVGNTLTPSFLANGKTNTELMRIAYVAMTRPRKLLVVAMPKNKAKLSNRFPPDKWDYVEL